MAEVVRCVECGGSGKPRWDRDPPGVVVCPMCEGEGAYPAPGPTERKIVQAWDAAQERFVGRPLEVLERHTPGGMAVVMWVVFPLIGMLGALLLWFIENM